MVEKGYPAGGPNHIPETATVPKPLSKRAQELRDQHYSEYAEALEQRDAAIQRAKHGEDLCAKASQKITTLTDEIGDLKSRMTGYQLERDEAVAKCARAENTLANIMAILRAADMPVAVTEIDFSEVIAKVPPTPSEMLQRVK